MQSPKENNKWPSISKRLDGKVFMVDTQNLKELSTQNLQNLYNQIEAHGGKIQYLLTSQVTHVITSQRAADAAKSKNSYHDLDQGLNSYSMSESLYKSSSSSSSSAGSLTTPSRGAKMLYHAFPYHSLFNSKITYISFADFHDFVSSLFFQTEAQRQQEVIEIRKWISTVSRTSSQLTTPFSPSETTVSLHSLVKEEKVKTSTKQEKKASQEIVTPDFSKTKRKHALGSPTLSPRPMPPVSRRLLFSPGSSKPTALLKFPKRREYCTICKQEFTSMEEHVATPMHVQFAANDDNYKELDNMFQELRSKKLFDALVKTVPTTPSTPPTSSPTETTEQKPKQSKQSKPSKPKSTKKRKPKPRNPEPPEEEETSTVPRPYLTRRRLSKLESGPAGIEKQQKGKKGFR